MLAAAIALLSCAGPAPFECRNDAAPGTSTSAPQVLMVGNSLIFDHVWRLEERNALVCAKQGATLADFQRGGLPPAANPDTIVAAFGTVEVVQSAPEAPDIEAFESDLTRFVSEVRARWPSARLLLLTAPPINAELFRDLEIDPHAIGLMNDAIRKVARTQGGVVIETGAALAAGGAPFDEAMTSDGVHLRPLAYERWESAIEAALAESPDRAGPSP